MKDELVIGRVRSSFGIAGEIKVESLSGESAHFKKLRTIVLRRGDYRRSYRVESVRTAHRAVLIKLEGVDTPESAANLRGHEIMVARESASKLKPGEYYYADLMNLDVMVDGQSVGQISAIRETGDRPLLEITLNSGKNVLVPFAEPFFGDIRLKSGQIDLCDAAVLE